MDRILQIKRELETHCPALELREGEPMARHTSFRVGGPVTLMALPKRAAEARAAFMAAARAEIRPYCFGKGSNLLVADGGLFGFAIKCGIETLEWIAPDTLYAGSGLGLAQAASAAMEKGRAGMEFAHGIPGTLGGALCMNAGAYGGEMAQIVLWADCVNREGVQERLELAQLQLSYRHSIFSADDSRLILGAALKLTPGEPAAIKARMMELMEQRRSKQPLEFPSAGSTFQRPPGQFAGALIEACGLKGLRIGGAQVSEKHAGFVINTGGASCKDILTLMRQIRQQVQEKFGVLLEPEVKLLGCTL